jgi:hypothetical protein
LLGDLPLVGGLFRSTNNTYSESERFVLRSPSVEPPAVPGSDLWLRASLGEVLSGVVTVPRSAPLPRERRSRTRQETEGGAALPLPWVPPEITIDAEPGHTERHLSLR